MDFTKRIKSLVVRQASKGAITPPESTVIGDLTSEPAVVKEKETRECPSDPLLANEILQSIEDVYYSEAFDSFHQEIQKFSDEMDLARIRFALDQLQRQHVVVSKRMSELILQNQTAYAKELQNVMDLQAKLEEALTICHSGRSCLSQAKKDFTTASLGILANYRKWEQLKGLLRSLHTIKTLQQTDVRLRELLDEGDYAGAIQLCLECQKAASTFRHYKCISELNIKLQDTLETIEEQLDVALSKVCSRFEITLYDKLQAAYSLLGKTQTSMDQLLMHFASAIHNKAFMIVLGHVELCSGSGDTNFQKKQYSDLCKSIVAESFTPCLIDLCKSLWEVLRSYWCIVEWHETNSPLLPSTENDSTENESNQSLSKKYVRQKLENGLARVWQDVQQKVKAYILASDLSTFKFDDFIQVLDVVSRLTEIGEQFCGSKSEDLQKSIHKQTVNYFRNHHRGCMEELHMFLENESWALCPVRANFSILHLQEFAFLRQSSKPTVHSPTNTRLILSHTQNNNNSSQKTDNKCLKADEEKENYMKQYSKEGNPFDSLFEDTGTEDVLLENKAKDGNNDLDCESDDDDVSDELKQDFIEEPDIESPTKRPEKYVSKPVSTTTTISKNRYKQKLIITNTTLNVLRLFGKYLHMMNVLRPIAFDVLICLAQLFDYYTYSVYVFFAKEMCDLSETAISNKLRSALKRIKDNLIQSLDDSVNLDGYSRDKFPAPSLSPVMEHQNDNQQLFQLAERIAAAESLVFLAEQIQVLRPQLELFIPEIKKESLQKFLSMTLSSATELRRPVYMTVSTRAINYENVLSLMSIIRWDIDTIMSQHSNYVDILLRELQVFSMRILEVSKRTFVPRVVSDLLWEHCIRLCNHTFIEGFSQAKKCTNEGRALMQLDYQQFMSKVEFMTDIRPFPEKELVLEYIKAFYLLEGALADWMKEHKEYSTKQLMGLIQCVTQINKKGRQRLISLMEDSDRIKKS